MLDMISSASSIRMTAERPLIASTTASSLSRHDAGLRSGPVDLDLLEGVREHRGELVALAESRSKERIGEPVHPRVELPEREPMPSEDERQVIGPVYAHASGVTYVTVGVRAETAAPASRVSLFLSKNKTPDKSDIPLEGDSLCRS